MLQNKDYQGVQIVSGNAETATKKGTTGFKITARKSGVIVKSIIQEQPDTGAYETVTDESWMNTALLQGEEIPLVRPIKAITLKNAGDSVRLDLQAV